MIVRDLIKELLDAPMESEVVIKTDLGILDARTVNYHFPEDAMATEIVAD